MGENQERYHCSIIWHMQDAAVKFSLIELI